MLRLVTCESDLSSSDKILALPYIAVTPFQSCMLCLEQVFFTADWLVGATGGPFCDEGELWSRMTTAALTFSSRIAAP